MTQADADDRLRELWHLIDQLGPDGALVEEHVERHQHSATFAHGAQVLLDIARQLWRSE